MQDPACSVPPPSGGTQSQSSDSSLNSEELATKICSQEEMEPQCVTCFKDIIWGIGTECFQCATERVQTRLNRFRDDSNIVTFPPHCDVCGDWIFNNPTGNLCESCR